MEKRTVDTIDRELTMLKDELEHVKGRETEVYTRIVGYFRAVENWNKGKKEEYKERMTFKFDKKKTEQKLSPILENMEASAGKTALDEENAVKAGEIASYKFFSSRFCRNCPPVKEFLKNISLKGEEVDVTTDLGINASKDYDIMSTPTVIFFDKESNEVARGSSVEELEKKFLKMAVAV